MTDLTDAKGHRQRLKTKVLKKGADALETYELLELLLFYAIPRRDTKPLAKALLKRFKNIGPMLQADPNELQKTYGLGESTIAYLKAMESLFQRRLHEELKDRPIIHNWQKALEYCQQIMAHETVEQFRIFYLDHKNNLIEDEIHQRGTVNHTVVYPREIIRKALNIGATGLVLAHNHPSGDPTPSREDIELTKDLHNLAKGLGVKVVDHFIVAREYYSSLKGLGYI